MRNGAIALTLAVVAVGAFVAGRYCTERSRTAPDETPGGGTAQGIERKAFTLSYPGDWRLETDDSDYDPEHLFTIEGPDSAFVIFTIADETGDPAQAAQTLAGKWRNLMTDSTLAGGFERWGNYDGVGKIIRGTEMSFPFELRVFAFSSSSRLVLVQEFLHVEDLEKAQRGFDLIASSFRLRD